MGERVFWVAAIKALTSSRYRNSRSRRLKKGVLRGGGELGTSRLMQFVTAPIIPHYYCSTQRILVTLMLAGRAALAQAHRCGVEGGYYAMCASHHCHPANPASNPV